MSLAHCFQNLTDSPLAKTQRKPQGLCVKWADVGLYHENESTAVSKLFRQQIHSFLLSGSFSVLTHTQDRYPNSNPQPWRSEATVPSTVPPQWGSTQCYVPNQDHEIQILLTGFFCGQLGFCHTRWVT